MIDDLGFCRKCGIVKESKVLPLCNRCYEPYKQDFNKIRVYLRTHPTSNAREISKDTKVPIEKILDFIKDGLIQVKK